MNNESINNWLKKKKTKIRRGHKEGGEYIVNVDKENDIYETDDYVSAVYLPIIQ